MQTDDFEKAFSDFLDRQECDQLAQLLFSFARISFLAGWRAAGGEVPQPKPPLVLYRQQEPSPH
ncbi:MAG: hypothetical protein DBX44_00340 [Oscillospiraceae bacterium]|nr:MAG: hypothetical protein DBX44_00340 [Oscillospiraceae bacterium]